MSCRSFAVLLTVLLVPLVTSLTCYENDKNGSVFERTNASWKYCSIVPAMGKGIGRLQGLGPMEEQTEGYDNLFGLSDNAYKVLTLCLLERYDFSNLSPKFSREPEFMFRCFCNYDRCNSAITFSQYITEIKETNE